MKRLFALLVIIGFSLSLDSCKIVSTGNQGKHKGWFKNTNNPHNPNSTNPGQKKKSEKGKGKDKN